MNTMRPLLKSLLTSLLLMAASPFATAHDGTALVVIAHPTVGRVDAPTLQRLYTGRAIEASGTLVTVVNLSPGHPLRERFLAQGLAQDNEKYVAYWTVRRHIGKGVPPREFKTPAEVIEFVQATPGGMGYIPASEWRQGMNVVFMP